MYNLDPVQSNAVYPVRHVCYILQIDRHIYLAYLHRVTVRDIWHRERHLWFRAICHI